MIDLHLKTTVNASPDELWDLLRDFNGTPKFLKAVASSSLEGEGVGAVRTLTLANGAQLQERLEEFDDSARRLAYSLVSGPLPVQSYVAVVQVSDLGDNRSELTWSTTFEPRGVSEDEAKGVVQGICQMGLQGIAEIFS